VITLVVTGFYLFILQPVLIKKFNVWKTFLWNFWIIVNIGVVNCVGVAFLYKVNVTVELLVRFQMYTLIPGMIISGIIILIYHNYKLRNRLDLIKEAKQIVKVDNAKELGFLYGLRLENIVFITSADNYIDICFEDNDTLRHKLVRTTMDNTEKDIGKNSYVMRCHRSFIVNLRYVDSIKGNAAGYRLKVSKVQEVIPVSRTYMHNVLKFFKQNFVA
jgi:hypothetical protein